MTGRKVVVLGLMTKIPVAGVVWQTAHYLLGLQALGYDPYYVEAHARAPSMLMRGPDDDGVAAAAAFIDGVMRRFGFAYRWAYQALHDDGRCYGLSERELMALYDSAELIINLHGGTEPRAEHSAGGRLVYVETDPVQLQVELSEGNRDTLEFLERHCAFFTFGENWGAPDCGLPTTQRCRFYPTRQPVSLGLWSPSGSTGASFTTIANWRQQWRDVTVDGRTYTWSKDVQFGSVLSLPQVASARFELALSGYTAEDRETLTRHGWTVVDADRVSEDPACYRSYIRESRGEFTVAKEQNVALRSGWFSDRSATYLAAGRPVVTEETGFSNILPTGAGLHAFAALDDAVEAIELVTADYESSRRAAREIAREYFAAEVVLGAMLAHLGMRTGRPASPPAALTSDLVLTPERRRPLRLPEATRSLVLDAPVPFPAAEPAGPPVASVVVISHDDAVLTRMCVESVLTSTDGPALELIVVDNGSRDETRVYLLTMERRFPNVRVILNDSNRGFAAACNQGLAAASGEVLVLLNADTIVPPGWLRRLIDVTANPQVGLVGPTTNRIGNEAEIATTYETYGEYLELAAELAEDRAGEWFELPMPAMFCLAFRRSVLERIGPIDERFGPGTLEDDDYARRARELGLVSACCEDVLVHHFGESSLGRLYPSGAYGRLLAGNRRAFEEKWGEPWQPYGRRPDPAYDAVRSHVREIVENHVPADATVLVVSRGDDKLLEFPGRSGWHFPQLPDGVYAGQHPETSADAIAQLERLRANGGAFLVVPRPSLWWLEHYSDWTEHLRERYAEVVHDPDCVLFALDGAR